MYLKRKIWNLKREARINMIQISKSALLTPKSQRKLDITKFEAGKLSGVVTKLQRRLDRLENLMSSESDRRSSRSDPPPPLESDSENSWGPGPEPSTSGGCIGAPRSDKAPSTHGSAQPSDVMPPWRSGEEERDEWLSADYRRHRNPLRNPVQPKRPMHALEAAAPAYGGYEALRDEPSEEDIECDPKGPAVDHMKDFGISQARGCAAGAACNQRRRSTWKAYAEESLEERTWRSRGKTACTSRSRRAWQR